MNVLQVLPRLEVGGVETGTVDLARYFCRKGHKVVVVSGGGRLVKELKKAGAVHYCLPAGSKNPFVIIGMVGRLRDIIRKEKIDVVHARSRVPALSSFFAARLTHRAFVTTAHGQYKEHLLSYVMGWGKFVIVAGSVMARHMIDNFGVRPDKIKIIPRGVDTEKFLFKLPSERKHQLFTVGMISRITPLKGHADFIKAVSILSRSVAGLKAYIVGDIKNNKSDYIKQIEILIKSLTLHNIVEFVEHTDDVPEILSKLDVVVSANREQEAFGRVIVEAQASGVPCVATNVGGVRETITDRETGLLCQSSNPKDMAARIMELYKKPELRDEIALKARDSVENRFTVGRMMESTREVYESAVSGLRILVVKISALGDVILAVPSLRAIRKKYPHAVIKVLVGKESRAVIARVPYVDEVLVCDFNGRDSGPGGFFRVAGKLRKEDFDIVVDFQNNKKSHILAFLTFARERYGYDNGKLSFLLNRKISGADAKIDPIDHQAKVLALLGISKVEKDIELFPSEKDAAWAENAFRDNWVKPGEVFVCFHMEASRRWKSKRWPVTHYMKLAEKLTRELGVRVVLTGQDAGDADNARFIKSAKSRPISMVGKTDIGKLVAVIKRCDAMVTSDTAPMHIAAGVKTPFVALFGPTDPGRHVFASGPHRVIDKRKKCGPCYKPACDKGYVCMKSISVDEVFSSLRELLGR